MGNKKVINTIHNKNSYHEVEDISIENELKFSFKLLFIVTMAFNLIVFFYSKDICNEVSYARCGIFYYIYRSQSFFIIMWIENIMAIVLGLYDIFLGATEKKVIYILKGLLFVLIQPIIWYSLSIFLNMSW